MTDDIPTEQWKSEGAYVRKLEAENAKLRVQFEAELARLRRNYGLQEVSLTEARGEIDRLRKALEETDGA